MPELKPEVITLGSSKDYKVGDTIKDGRGIVFEITSATPTSEAGFQNITIKEISKPEPKFKKGDIVRDFRLYEVVVPGNPMRVKNLNWKNDTGGAYLNEGTFELVDTQQSEQFSKPDQPQS